MKITSELELQELTDVVMGLSALKFFPQAEQGLVAIVSDIAEIVSSMDHARWLVKRMRELFDEWPGPVTLRETYIARYPAQNEPDEDPPHPHWHASLPSPLRQLSPPDPDKVRTFGAWPEELLIKPKVPVRQIPKETPLLVPGKDFKPITAEDIEEARRTRQTTRKAPPIEPGVS